MIVQVVRSHVFLAVSVIDGTIRLEGINRDASAHSFVVEQSSNSFFYSCS